MAGTFPLRMADLLFTDEQLIIPEYQYLTPIFGIARGKTHDVAETAVERYRAAGTSGLVEFAERTHRVDYDDLNRVRLYDGRAVAVGFVVERHVAVACGRHWPSIPAPAVCLFR